MDKSTSYLIAENKLVFENSELLFDYPIKESLVMEGMLIVRLEMPFKIIYNENVLGISLSEQKIKWRIVKRKYREQDCPFISITQYGNFLKLFNWCGFYFIIDPITGGILEESLPAKY